MAKRQVTPPFEEYPQWSEAKFFSFLRSALRSATVRWPPKYEVLNAARRPAQSDNKRLKWEFKCSRCGNWFPKKEVAVDHTVPAGALKSFDDLPGFCKRLFVGVDKLQLLCSACHHDKTTAERAD